MSKDEINKLVDKCIELDDEVYIGVEFKHNWKCRCGNMIECRSWHNIKERNSIQCKTCLYKDQESRYKTEVEKTGEYEYIRSYRKHDVLPSGKTPKAPYLQIKHKYCESIYEVLASNFINKKQRCGKCCQKYENSFAYHIEVELGEPLDKYWDFEKNTVNPYHISRASDKKVWIRCQEKDYHGSYEIKCSNFVNRKRCSYCGGKKIHPKDSFGQYLKDNNLLHLWSDKNTVDPFTISKSTGKKVWMLCDKHDYHNDYGGYEISCDNFIKGNRCGYCRSNKIHPLDSFGYHNFDKVLSWHPDNNISPFRVSRFSHKKYRFICYECHHDWRAKLSHVSNGTWCPKCKSSKGEIRVKEYLDKNNIDYIHDEPYFKDLLSDLGNPLRPDFILPKHKIWIEYDGEFHFKDFYKDGSYESLKKHDECKDEYAKNNGWKMIRIPYTKFDEIETILNDIFGGDK